MTARSCSLAAIVAAAAFLAQPAFGAQSRFSTRCSVAPGSIASGSSATGPVSFNYPRATGATAAYADAASQTLRGFADARMVTAEDDCTTNASFQNALTIGAGSTGLHDGDPVRLRLSLDLTGIVDEGPLALPQPFLDWDDASAQYRIDGPVVCGREGCYAETAAAFSFSLRRVLDAFAGSIVDPDGSFTHQLRWSWDLASNTDPYRSDRADLYDVICPSWPCVYDPTDARIAPFALPVQRWAVEFASSVGATLPISASINTLVQSRTGPSFTTTDLLNTLHAEIAPADGYAGLALRYDTDAQPALSIDDVTVRESDGTATFDVALSHASTVPVSVRFRTVDGTARAGEDYESKDVVVEFAPGELNHPVTVGLLWDDVEEPPETFTGHLSEATGATIARADGVATIIDEPRPPALSIADAAVTEGDTGTTSASFTVSLSHAAGTDVSVDYATADDTATAPADYTATHGTLVIPLGSTSATIDVPIVGELAVEADETFTVTLAHAANAAIARSTAVGTIVNDDYLPAATISGTSQPEGNAGTTSATFAVALDRPPKTDVSIDYATSDASATAPGDYAATSGTLIIPVGSTSATVDVPVVGDALYEADETFTLTLSNPRNVTLANATATATILNDDAKPKLIIDDPSASESSADVTFTLALSAPSGLPVSVDVATADDTAVAGLDYTAQSQTVTIAPGATTRPVHVQLLQDTLDEDDETFTLSLSNEVGASIFKSTGTATIVDDDPPPALSIADASVVEGSLGVAALSFAVTLSQASGKQVSVAYATSDGSATAPGDYGTAGGTLTFAPGSTAQSITVFVNGDTTIEPDETFTVSLASPVNASVADGSAVGTILNDDYPPVTVEVEEGILVADGWQVLPPVVIGVSEGVLVGDDRNVLPPAVFGVSEGVLVGDESTP
jgi:Calx-beta domain